MREFESILKHLYLIDTSIPEIQDICNKKGLSRSDEEYLNLIIGKRSDSYWLRLKLESERIENNLK